MNYSQTISYEWDHKEPLMNHQTEELEFSEVSNGCGVDALIGKSHGRLVININI